MTAASIVGLVGAIMLLIAFRYKPKTKNGFDPYRFIVKPVHSGFSENYVRFKYTRNNGFTWDYVMGYSPPDDFETGLYTMGKFTYYGSLKDDWSSELKQFSSYPLIQAFEEKERLEMEKKNKDLQEKRKAIVKK